VKRIIVIGAGVAGLAAAFSARRKGHEVVVVSKGSGASALGGGAVDDVPWEDLARAARVVGKPIGLGALEPDVVAFSEALGIWDLPAEGAPPPFVATIAGRLRPCRGHDAGLLDLGALRDGCVLLPRADRAAWDADAIARTLSAEPIAKHKNLRFVAVDAPVLRFTEEARFPDGDLAVRHDEPARLAWLAERLREAVARNGSPDRPVVGALVGSWLGAQKPRAKELSTLVGLPVGEALVGAGSAAGLRFEAARKRMLGALRVEVIEDHARSIAVSGDTVKVTLSRAGAALEGDIVVLAIGGVVAGGVVYAPPEHVAGEDLPPRGAVPYVLSVDAPVSIGASSRRLDVVASIHGPELDTSTWSRDARPSALEDVGVIAPKGVAARLVLAAGDVVAGKPRTLLEAVSAGLFAGAEAYRPWFPPIRSSSNE
jgi:glycerol-3-phosphate dehydrogenase subunit B